MKDAESPATPEDPAFRRMVHDEVYGSGLSALAGMNQREQDELLLFSGTRKQRKAAIERRRANLNEYQLEQFLLIHGSWKERRAARRRQKAREAQGQGQGQTE